MYNSGRVIIISLLFCNFAILTEGSFLMEQIIANNRLKVLEKFFAEYRIHLEETDAWDATVIGASEDQFRSAKPLLEDFPYLLGTNVTRICTAEAFSSYTMIFNFLARFEEEYLQRVFDDLRRYKRSETYLIFEGNSEINFGEVRSVKQFRLGPMKNPPLFVHHFEREDSLKVYGHRKVDNCSMKMELITDWMAGDGVKELHDSFKRPVPMSGCCLNIAAMHRLPWIKLDSNANGEAIIKGGTEGDTILEFINALNYVPVVRDFSDQDKSHTTEAIVASCAAGDTSIGIGRIRTTKSLTSSRVSVLPIFIRECVVWCVPRITWWKRSPFFGEFSSITWMLMGLMFVASIAIEKTERNTRRLNRGNVRKPDCVRIMLDIVGVTLGNPIIYRPVSLGSKVLLIIYICYSTVMTTAYKSSLTSMFTVENVASTIVDVEGIIRTNLTTGGDVSMLTILEDQRNESKWTPELIKRYVIETDTSKALRRVSNDQDFAYLTSRSDLEYHKALFERSGEEISFDVLDGCVLNYDIVAVFPKESRQTKEFGGVLHCLVESGILTHLQERGSNVIWVGPRLTEKTAGMVNTQRDLAKFTRDTIFVLFYHYCALMVFCLWIFIGEIIINKSRYRERDQRLDNLKVLNINPLHMHPVNHQSVQSTHSD